MKRLSIQNLLNLVIYALEMVNYKIYWQFSKHGIFSLITFLWHWTCQNSIWALFHGSQSKSPPRNAFSQVWENSRQLFSFLTHKTTKMIFFTMWTTTHNDTVLRLSRLFQTLWCVLAFLLRSVLRFRRGRVAKIKQNSLRQPNLHKDCRTRYLLGFVLFKNRCDQKFSSQMGGQMVQSSSWVTPVTPQTSLYSLESKKNDEKSKNFAQFWIMQHLTWNFGFFWSKRTKIKL